MVTNSALAEAIRTRILNGTLPRDVSLKLEGGPGEGGHCACCGQVISETDIQYTVSDGDRAVSLTMHLHCYGLWSLEVRLLATAQR